MATRKKKPVSQRAWMAERQESYPQPPLPKQHQESPGLESEVRRRPKYQARPYRRAGKLEGKVALITESSFITGEIISLFGGDVTGA